MLKELPPQLVTDGRLIGLEKESLRVQADGGIAQSGHPLALGAALTNPHITTDYSEALLEIVSPPMESGASAIEFLDDAHRFLYPRLPDGETIWATSMPCVLSGNDSIRVGEYGQSNTGVMKHVYRRGLGLRYGKSMQAIAGVHFNFSLPDTFWQSWFDALGSEGSVQAFKTTEYFHMTRNLLRLGWLVPYLFGASPAVCTSFLSDGKPLPGMKRYGDHTCYEPFGTSLRVGDIGYVYRKDAAKPKIRVSYNDLDSYIADLLSLIEEPDEQYAAIGLVGDDGMPNQLSLNRLQIENEYYSSVRPKQIPDSGEMPLLAMARRGIRYLELRSIDINVFEPAGVGVEQVHFLETMMLYSLLRESPPMSHADIDRVSENMTATAHRGRDPALKLRDEQSEQRSVRDWGLELMDAMSFAATMLDQSTGTDHYSLSLELQRQKFLEPELTPSARVLREMHDNHSSFYDFAWSWSGQHENVFKKDQASRDEYFVAAADRSFAKLAEIESESIGSFDDYLERYFEQLQSADLARFRGQLQPDEMQS